VRSRFALGAVVALGAALIAGGSGAASLPYLRTVSVHQGHVVAVFSAGELAPLRLAVATSPRVGIGGAFPRTNVRFTEIVGTARPAGSASLFRTRHTLTPGRYWVELSARPTDVDCLPLKPCLERWSNVRLLVVPGNTG
jgi:hypothetical protein